MTCHPRPGKRSCHGVFGDSARITGLGWEAGRRAVTVSSDCVCLPVLANVFIWWRLRRFRPRGSSALGYCHLRLLRPAMTLEMTLDAKSFRDQFSERQSPRRRPVKEVKAVVRARADCRGNLPSYRSHSESDRASRPFTASMIPLLLVTGHSHEYQKHLSALPFSLRLVRLVARRLNTGRSSPANLTARSEATVPSPSE